MGHPSEGRLREDWAPKITREAFEQGYAERSGVSVEQLHEQGREARPCDCEWEGDEDGEGCEGWQMARVRERESSYADDPVTGLSVPKQYVLNRGA